MFDAHYDLLTILYCCYLKNDFSYIEKLQDDLADVSSLIANLYFMNKDEMKEKLLNKIVMLTKNQEKPRGKNRLFW